MKISKLIPIVTLVVSFSTASAQSILQDYFKGNKDSLIKEAYKLIDMPDPSFKSVESANIDSGAIKDMGFEQVYKTEDYFFSTRDHKKIFAARFKKKSNNTIILIHGVASNSFLYNKTAGLLRESTRAEVFAIDLRGHGRSEGKDGDVDYINQYADDLADIVAAIRKQKPTGKIIIAGHSMGGGVALNYCMQKTYPKVDGYILFTPLLGQNSPAIRQSSPATKDENEPFMKIHFARIIGLKMFNEIEDHSHDSLPVLFLNLPPNMPSRLYTYRADMSMAPEDYKSGLNSVDKPMVVLIGNKDEIFDADAMKKALEANSRATIVIVEGATHNGIRHQMQSHRSIQKWFAGL